MDGAAANRLEMVLRSDLSELGRLAAAVESFIARNRLFPDLAFRFTLCLDELVTNIVSHGRGGGGGHGIRVRLETDGLELRAEVEDDADAFDPFAEAPSPDLGGDLESRRIGGLGVFLVGKLMDRASHRREGGLNLTVLAKRIA
ncbi:ATP-binding protein [Azospirillum sp. TSH64]|uniref:ATP-binding protein n=1 Tax=Azospirillum sp. TSH64 TaxID=652740 RepID=UPI000D64D49B|nr:ATP-binding protein [Azospirillum sp. TSH64]